MDQNEVKNRIVGVVSLVLSIIGAVFLVLVVFVKISGLWFSVGCAAFSLTALILSITTRRRNENRNKATLAAMIISAVTLTLFVVLWTLIFGLFFLLSEFMHFLSGIWKMG